MRRDTELTGRTFFESGLVDSWVDFCAHEVELPSTMVVYPILGFMEKKQAGEFRAGAGQGGGERAVVTLRGECRGGGGWVVAGRRS